MLQTTTQRPSVIIGNHVTYYTIYTLIDVTDANVISPRASRVGFFQSQNLNTFMQTVGLRTQPVINSITILQQQNTSKYKFGSAFNDTNQTVWALEFSSGTERTLQDNNEHIALLVKDFKFIPVHTGLNETVAIENDVINTDDEMQLNTYFIFDPIT